MEKSLLFGAILKDLLPDIQNLAKQQDNHNFISLQKKVVDEGYILLSAAFRFNPVSQSDTLTDAEDSQPLLSAELVNQECAKIAYETLSKLVDENIISAYYEVAIASPSYRDGGMIFPIVLAISLTEEHSKPPLLNTDGFEICHPSNLSKTISRDLDHTSIYEEFASTIEIK